MAEISSLERAELLSLLAAYCDDTISDVDGARLEEMLSTSDFREQAADIYLEYVSLHWDLRKEILREQALDSVKDLPLVPTDVEWFVQEVPLTGEALPDFLTAELFATPAPERFSLSAVLSEYSLALAGLAGALAVMLIVSRLIPHGPETYVPSFAVLKPVGECVWAPTCRLASAHDQVKLGRGLELAPGEVLDLVKGNARISLAAGVELVIDAPARAILLSSTQCKLAAGRLYANVSPSAVGFTISVPTMDVVDLGTEFGVEVFDSGASEVHVLKGKVELRPGDEPDANRAKFSGEPHEVAAGSAIRAAPRVPGVGLDLVDLVCGGDGLGLRQGTAVDPGAGEFGVLSDKNRPGDGIYHHIHGHRALDGCFLPNKSTLIDSDGHTFEFSSNSSSGCGFLICAGGGVDHLLADRVIPDNMRSVVFAPSPQRMLLMHPNAGLTFDLSKIRRQAAKSIRGFRATVLDPDVRETTPKGDVYVLVDGVLRFERLAFTVADTPFGVRVPLNDSDRFLTLVTTDGGDSGVGDWITWGDAVLETKAQ
jgi:hypothetical protein